MASLLVQFHLVIWEGKTILCSGAQFLKPLLLPLPEKLTLGSCAYIENLNIIIFKIQTIILKMSGNALVFFRVRSHSLSLELKLWLFGLWS